MLLQHLLITSLTLTVIKGATLSISPTDEVQTEQIIRNVESSRKRVKRAIFAKLFKDYPSIVTGHLLQSQLLQRQNSRSGDRSNTLGLHPNRFALRSKVMLNSPFIFRNIKPEVTVEVKSENINEDIRVALMPDMSTYDSINAARTLYEYLHEHELLNPFSVDLQVLRVKGCAIIHSIGGIEGVWNVKVAKHGGEVLHNDICIPRRSQMTMRPGYSIVIQKSAEPESSVQS